MSNLFHETIIPEKLDSAFLNEEFERIYHQTIEDFQNAIPYEQFIEIASAFNQGSKEYKIEFCTKLQGLMHYIWLDKHQEKAIAATFDDQNTIHSILLKPFVTYPKSDNRYTKNSYILPITGEWFVFWGGENEFINYHYVYEPQRYAYDLIQVKDKLSYNDTPQKNENYYAFNQEILAPADGEVIRVVDGIEDNVPGEMNSALPAGNYVFIKHKHEEYSMLAHLKQSSIQVKEGDHVKEGQSIGLCGNSGNSSEPHLHFQVMDTPSFDKGKSIRIRFKGIKEPIQGDYIYGSKSYRDTFDEK